MNIRAVVMDKAPRGSIEIITGPMFSGKSEELIRRLCRARIARLITQVVKHQLDTRYSDAHIVTHSAWRIPSQSVSAATDLLRILEPEVQVLGIDEAHFFDEALVPVVQTLAGRGVRVIIAGLDLDYLGRPFGPMPQLFALAQEVTKFHAICVCCGTAAHFSQRVVPSRERILIGAGDSYEPRCRSCFVPGTSSLGGQLTREKAGCPPPGAAPDDAVMASRRFSLKT